MFEYTKKEYTTDVLVIGGGIAAVFAATRALDNGAKVMMIDKGSVGRSGQTPFASAFALYDPESTGERSSGERSEWHRMMNENGKGVNNPAYLDTFMDYSKGVYEELTDWGATDPGFGGVFRTQIQSRDIELLERTMVTNLLYEGKKVVGVTGFDLETGEAIIAKAKAVILCTGAGGFKPNGFQIRSLTFDGDAMAYRIGAKISGKEYTDGHFLFEDTPAYCWGQWSGMWERGLPSIVEGPMDGGGDAVAITDALNVHVSGISSSSDDMQSGPPSDSEGEGQSGPPSDEESTTEGASEKPSGPPSDEETTTEGEDDQPSGPPSDGEEGAEGEEGGGRPSGGGGGASMSSRINGASVGLSVHKAEGLFPADNQCRSNIEGLFAAGDSLSSMLVGAIYNGVGGFALAGSGVQGAQAGEVAATYVKNLSEPTVSESTISTALEYMYGPINNEQGYSPGWVEHLIQGILTPYYVLYVKSEDRLNAALTNIEFYRDHFSVKLRADDIHDLRKAHEVKNMLLNAEMKLRSSLFRTESRGNHYREDFPDRNDEDWLAWVVLQKGADGVMELEKFNVVDFQQYVV